MHGDFGSLKQIETTRIYVKTIWWGHHIRYRLLLFAHKLEVLAAFRLHFLLKTHFRKVGMKALAQHIWEPHLLKKFHSTK